MMTNERIFIDRPPRIQPELPIDEIDIPAPPDKKEDGYSKLIQVSLPLITLIGYVLVSTLGGVGRSPWLMIPMALSVLASMAFSIYTYFKEKGRRAEAEKAYADRIIELYREMRTYHNLQRRFYRHNYPDPSTVAQIVHNARIEIDKLHPSLRSRARLWERRTSDDDFGVVRLGIGTLPSTVIYTIRDASNFDDPQVREALKLDADSRFVSDIPISISLRQPKRKEETDEDEQAQQNEERQRTAVTHALGIAGQSGLVYQFVRSLLAHYLAFHTPTDAKLYVLASKRQEWTWTEQAPHTQGDEQDRFCCFLDTIEKREEQNVFLDDEGELERFLEGIRKVLATRKIRLQEHNDSAGSADPTLPHLLIVVDLLDVADDAADPLSQIESDAAVSILLEEGAMLGASVIFLVPKRSNVPSGCRSVIEIERTAPATNSKIDRKQTLYFRYAETGVNSFRYVGEADSVATRENIDTLAQELAVLAVRQGAGANLASAVPFLDLMGYASLADLQLDSRRRWQDSTQPQYANWLRVKLGLMSGNKPRTLVFSAKRDGVHGMVAGSTGSGKSELLISLITAMGITYDPSVINFVLVDYKGGGAFKEFETLPHCVDIITNLSGNGVTRMFTAINAEMQRRQSLNAQTGTKNIVEYRRQGLHLTHHPYPFLFIIIDEFAEMIADRSEFKAQLESITRVGRAQGVSLILAAQRPSGVTDQMRSNIKFRICLRVETPGESREMLRRSEAAFLPAGIPGRGYLQVGNEEIELVQVGYCGDIYVDPHQSPQDKVIWPERSGRSTTAQDQTPPELYKVIIDTLKNQADELGVPKQRAPWPNFLPTQLSLSQRLTSYDPMLKAVTSDEYLSGVDDILLGQPRGPELTLNPAINSWLNGVSGWLPRLDWPQYAMRPVVGLVDSPYGARQLPLVVDLPRGHVVIFAASGWGKTTFLRSLAISLAATHSPNHFHAYILDLGGRNLRVLENLPHVGALIIPDEEGYQERVEQLLREIEEIIEKRKLLLNNAGVPDIYQYNHSHPDDVQPAILLAIDNFLEFIETFGSQEDNVESVLDKFIGIVRQAKPYGIHVAVTSNRSGDLSSQLYNLFTERFTLKLSDPSEYRTILGRHVDDIADIAGRGYTKIGTQPLSFQVAVPLDLWAEGQAEPLNETRELEQLVQTMRDYADRSGQRYQQPVRVDALPKAVLFKQLLARQHRFELDRSFLEHLAAITRQKWAESLDPAHADWLKASLGVISGNRPRTLQLEAKKDGVHGLIAGGTGAGKSELLMTLIVGLALNYDPSVLTFVLVDYKGGGAFAPFEGLPHCVDLITNLNKAAVRRMFTAISAEMQRRQALCAHAGVKDIVEYRAKGMHRDPQYGPLPHLFVIIDEYAEMITDSPEFKDELDSITRVGRSIGVNLLLAAQRPTGVTDQMRANIKYRICLRVEGVDTSREMLRRSDAAFLPSGMPGRGYLQVGNEHIELIQVAYTGEPYEYAETPEGGERPAFYDVVVRLANDLLQGDRPRTPWPPFLPSILLMSEPLNPSYVDPSYVPLMTLNRTDRLALNPFMVDWLNGKGQWLGMDWDKTAMRAVVGLLDDPARSRQLPLVVDFTRGHAVLFGASGWGKTSFLRSLITSLACTHSPNEFQAHVLDLGGRNLEVLQALPHVGTVIMPDEQGYEERVHQLWREMGDIVDQRKRQFSVAGVSTLVEYNSTHPEQLEPAILIVIDNFAEYIETFGNTPGKDSAADLLDAFVTLARQGKAYGLHIVITVTRLNVLSSKLYSLFTERLTLRLSDSGDYSSIVGSNIGDIEELPGRGYTKVGRVPMGFQIALPPGSVDHTGQVRGEARQIRLIGQKMSEQISRFPHRYREPLRIGALPKSSSYRKVVAEQLNLNLEQPNFLDALKTATSKTWEHNASAEHADWLRVVLGITSGNRNRMLQLEAKRDGVHGMVAGGTGSGKSEMLMTLIVGLALNYSPEILNFVLVDYKGGGAFKPFERLPHCVDSVTNLNKAAVDRMFTAINAEIRRRQALNAETGTKDIVEYRRKGLHKSHEPYPHLFIIIDEYAEMLDSNPEYLPSLESITRVGRAQGVNLLLASQRPKGVSDQMRANIKLRLCLRVEQIETSRELLRRPDAALLPSGMPGRGYLQIGNENLELIQISYTGESQLDDREPPVLWPERPPREAVAEETPTFYDAVVTLSADLTKGRPTPKPWPSFLPQSFSLESPLVDAQRNRAVIIEPAISDWVNGDTHGLWPGVDWRTGALRPAIILVDDPAQARQEPYAFELSRNHLAIFGDSGWGKTTALRSILISLAATHSPNEYHAYVLDLGGRNFRSLEALPHVGAAIYADEEAFDERLQRLLEKLVRLAEERQRILGEADVGSLYEFNAHYPDKLMPAVVVAIDNFAALQESYEGLVEGTLLPLIRRSLSVGITFIITANAPNNLPSKLFNLLGERITFKQGNLDRYMDIVGRGAIEIDDVPGRGYVRVGRQPLQFQAALPLGIFGAEGRITRPEAEELRLIGERMQAYLADAGGWRSRPDPIQILPEHVSLREMLEEAGTTPTRHIQAVLGQTSNLRPAILDLKRMGPHFAIVGPPLSGKTTTLYSWIFSLAARYAPDRVRFVLIDTQGKFARYGGSHSLAELPHVLSVVNEVEHMASLLAELKAECQAMADSDRASELFIFIDNFDDFSEEIERNRDLVRELAALARRYGSDGLHFIISGTLDGPSSDLRRRVQSANYGIGLRTAQAVETLRVLRTPSEVRSKELPIGRGYLIKSGQATMVQIASPYEGQGLPASRGEPGEEEERVAQALDSWVQWLCAAHPEQRARWITGDGHPAPTQEVSPQQSARLQRMQGLLRQGMQREIERLQAGNGAEDLLIARLVALEVDSWGRQDVLLSLLKELLLKEKVASGLPQAIVESLYGAMDEESLLLELEASLASASGS